MSNILVLSGFDPSAGAGVIRDVMTINNCNANPFAVVTVNTSQNTKQFHHNYPIANDVIIDQLKLLAQDFKFDAVKIGLLHDDNEIAIDYLLKTIMPKKIIIDPILKSSTNKEIGSIKLISKLLKFCYIITPNFYELQKITNEKNIDKAVKKISTPYVLLTMTESSDDVIAHKLYHHGVLLKEFYYQKLPYNFHGSGCMLSSIIAVYSNNDIIKCCELALQKTYKSLQCAIKLGSNQYHPKI